MANNLKMDMVFSILTLHNAGWSDRRIARELGVHRETVARYLQLAKASGNLPAGSGRTAKPANDPPTGSGAPPKPAMNPPTGSDGLPDLPAGSANTPKPVTELPAGSADRSKPATNPPTGSPEGWAGFAGAASDFGELPSGPSLGSTELAEVRAEGSRAGARSQVQAPADGGFIALPPTASEGNVPGAVAEDRALLGSNLSAAAAPYGTGGLDSIGAACFIDGGVCEQTKGGPVSDSEPWREIIEAKVQQGLAAQRIWQDLVEDHNFTSGYDSVKRFVRKLGASRPLPFRRMECPPGQEAQVDFGTGAPILGADGRRRKCHVFRAVLGYSRKGYSEAVFRQTTDDFLLCLEDAFWHIGGVPRVTTIDNLRAAVTHPDWYDPELNPKVQSFCQHYGTVILPTKPYHPRHKGKVERGVAYVQDNGLKGRSFASLADENRHLEQWEATVADTRIHGTTRRQVGRMFQEVEKPALLPLPAGRFPFFHEAQRRVHRDGHVAVERAFYSVPPEYLGRSVWVRWDGRMVRVFNRHMEQVAVHAQHQPGQFSTQNQHIDPKKTSAVERGVDWLMGRVSLIGPQTERWAEAMLEDRGVAGVRVLVGLRSLAGRYDSERIEGACQIALTHEAFHLRTIRELIKRGGDRQTEFEFLQEHEIIRDLSDYGRLVRAAQSAQPATDPSLE